MHGHVARQAGERFDRDLGAVIADRARQKQREAERADLAEQDRRSRLMPKA